MNKKIKPDRYLITGALLLCLVVFLSFLASCTGSNTVKPDLTIWSGMPPEELKVLREVAAEFGKEHGVTVSIINVPFTELKIKFQIAAPAGQGPDIVTGPQDWIGGLATADLIDYLTPAEFDEEMQKPYSSISLQSMTYNRKLYGVPMVLETIAVISNKKHCPEPPKTFDEMLQKAADFHDSKTKRYGFFFEVTNLYYAWPILAGFGSQIFAETEGNIDVEKVLLNSPQTLTGLRYLADMKQKYKLIPDGATTDMMSGVFFEDNMMFCLNGPWMLGKLREQKIEYDIFPLPPLPNGERPKPFVGVQGLILNKQTKNRELAVRFMHFVNKPEYQKQLALASGRIPSREDTLEMLKDYEDIIKFSEAVKYGSIMPNHPAIDAVWQPMNEGLTLVIINGRDPVQILPIEVKAIQENIKTMME